MNLNDLEFYRKFLYDNGYKIVNNCNNKRIDLGGDEFKINNKFLDLCEIKDKINSYCDDKVVNYVFKQDGKIVVRCLDYIIDDEEFDFFLRKELGLSIVSDDNDGDYYYIECCKYSKELMMTERELMMEYLIKANEYRVEYEENIERGVSQFNILIMDMNDDDDLSDENKMICINICNCILNTMVINKKEGVNND